MIFAWKGKKAKTSQPKAQSRQGRKEGDVVLYHPSSRLGAYA
jgi:hypothetical protein